MFLLFLLLHSIPDSEQANILVTAPFIGSHYMAMSDIGVLLAQQGHKVTFVSMMTDTHVTVQHENFKVIPPWMDSLTETEFNEVAHACINKIIELERDYYMYPDTMAADSVCRSVWIVIYRSLIEFYTSNQFLYLIETENFDVIIAEERTALPILAVTNSKDIPLAVYIPEIMYSAPREIQNLPQFLSSEPGVVTQVFNEETQGFWYRFYALYNFMHGIIKLKSAIDRMLEPVYARFNIESTELLQDRIQLFIVNDHLAFSFPFQIANNVVQVGGSALKEGKPLQGELKSFVDQQRNPIVFVSMGTYTDITWTKWYKILISILEKSDLSVILKIHEETKHKLPRLSDKFYTSTWVPQRDLLASGKVKLFISHCGNNGKTESIYYHVPLLCTPVMGEQALNGYTVRYRGFGEMILPQEMTEDNIRSVITRMLQENDYYKANMQQATDIYQAEPANGQEKLLYYLNVLIKYKNLDYLVNKIAKKQTSLEMYHLDIIMFILLSAALACFLTIKCICCGARVFIQRSRAKQD